MKSKFFYIFILILGMGTSMFETRASEVASKNIFQSVVQDQWSHDVLWNQFATVPKILVFGGKEAALESRAWGAHFQTLFNSGFQPSPEHLQTLNPGEKVKVIAVATLPDVPGMFKGLFRSGFRREAKNMGLVLDFAPGLSQSVGYVENGNIPLIVMYKKTGEEHARFSGLLSDAELKENVEKSVQELLGPKAAP